MGRALMVSPAVLLILAIVVGIGWLAGYGLLTLIGWII